MSTVILNWNRLDLIRITVHSYLATIAVPFELMIVDSCYSDGSQDFIRQLAAGDRRCAAVLLDENQGGEAVNTGLERAHRDFLHVSENDCEYLDGWDHDLLARFHAFAELGRLSPCSPYPRIAEGEIWKEHEFTPVTRRSQTTYVTWQNVGTTCMLRRGPSTRKTLAAETS